VSCRRPIVLWKLDCGRFTAPHSPLEKTPHKAGVVSVTSCVAVVAFFEVATEDCRSANLDGPHDTQLLQGKRVSFPVTGSVRSKNVGHFESGPRHPELFPGLRLRAAHQPVEWAERTGGNVRGYLGIARGGVDPAVAQQHLNDACVRAIFQQVRGERMAERVGRDALVDATTSGSIAARLREGSHRKMPVLSPGREHPLKGLGGAEVTAEYVPQPVGQHDISVFAPFALFDADQFAFRVDVAHLERDGFGNAQPGAITGHQCGAVPEAGDVLEELGDLFRAEHDRELVGPPDTRKTLFPPRHFEGFEIQKLRGGDEGVDALRREFSLMEQVQFVLPQRFQVELIRAGVVELGVVGDVVDVTSLWGGREATQLHVLDKPLSERCHFRDPSDWNAVTGITVLQSEGRLAPATTGQPQTARYRCPSAPDTA
jgi:hypothetical protein